MRSSAAVARPHAPGSGDRDKSPDGTRVYAAASPRIDNREIEWIRSDSANGEVSKFVSDISGVGPAATATRNNPRRCCRTSTSSGYSSHSPPLSAGSYSYYATSAFTSTSTSTKDPYGGLAVIHESETIPRPVWPSAIYQHAEDRITDYRGLYTCRVCDCTYGYSLAPSPPLPPPPLPPPPSESSNCPLPRASAREVLLELSRTLNSVIDGNATATPEDILRDISRIVSLRIGSKNDGVYECICSSWTSDDKNTSVSSCVKHVPSRVNPVNSKMYVGSSCIYGHKSARSVPLLQNSITRCEKDGEARDWTKKLEGTLKHCETLGPYTCKYLDESNAKLSFRLDREPEQCRNGFASTESKYSMQLKCGDAGTSSEGTVPSSSVNNWNRRLAIKSSIEDLDFTLDVTRAERLGRTIARAKRRRRWCRVLTTLFGLVFFVLSVVVVSLSVTKGRKIFGSM